MNSDLRLVCDWLKLNQLTLNIKKSQFMLIGSNSRLRRIESIVISANGKQLKEAQSFPYLGLIINQNLTWEDHIEHLRNKINKKLGLLRRIKSCLPLSARITFFNSFVLALFDYGDIIWGDQGNITLMAELQILHNWQGCTNHFRSSPYCFRERFTFNAPLEISRKAESWAPCYFYV